MATDAAILPRIHRQNLKHNDFYGMVCTQFIFNIESNDTE